jgi:hypothetical protein
MGRAESHANVWPHCPNGRLMSGSSRSSHNIWRYLEEHLDVLLAERKIAYFIDDKQLWGHDTAIECNFVGTLALSSRQL